MKFKLKDDFSSEFELADTLGEIAALIRVGVTSSPDPGWSINYSFRDKKRENEITHQTELRNLEKQREEELLINIIRATGLSAGDPRFVWSSLKMVPQIIMDFKRKIWELEEENKELKNKLAIGREGEFNE